MLLLVVVDPRNLPIKSAQNWVSNKCVVVVFVVVAHLFVVVVAVVLIPDPFL